MKREHKPNLITKITQKGIDRIVAATMLIMVLLALSTQFV